MTDGDNLSKASFRITRLGNSPFIKSLIDGSCFVYNHIGAFGTRSSELMRLNGKHMNK